MHVRSRGSGGHDRAHGAWSPTWIVDPERHSDTGHAGGDNANDTRSSASTSSSFFADAFSVPRHLHLHAFDRQARRIDYVEVKIGGHALDHKHIMDATPVRVHGPLKKAVGTAATTLTKSNQSPAFESHERALLVYAPVKIGGHAMDHVRFFNRGMPSRPLWGFAGPGAPRLYQEDVHPPIRVVFPGIANPAAEIPRALPNLYDCSHCRRMRQSARVQLCCGHALCAECLASDALRHVIVDGNKNNTVDAVVFSRERVLRVDHSDAPPRTLRDLQSDQRQRQRHLENNDHDHHSVSSLATINWRSGSALAVLALIAGRAALSSPRLRKRVAHTDTELPPSPSSSQADTMAAVLEQIAEASDTRLENGQARWNKRLHGLQPPCKLLKYSFVRTLGVGNFAEVMLVRNRKGELCVLKESDKLQEAVNEIGLLSKIRSPHVVRIAEYFVQEIGHRHFAYIEMEFCDKGDLLRRLQNDGAMDAATFDHVFRQLCVGLQEIHARGIIHRDLKPGNVLLTSDGLAKIADFGVSTCLESDLLTHHAAGTLAFMAPEVRRYFLGENVSYDTKADIWSLGALAVAMLSGDPEPRVATRVAEEVVDELASRHGICDRHAKLLTRLLDVDPRKRPSLEELLELLPPMNARL